MSLGDVKGDSSAEVLVAIGRTGLEERATSTSPPASREKTSGTVHPLGHERVQAWVPVLFDRALQGRHLRGHLLPVLTKRGTWDR